MTSSRPKGSPPYIDEDGKTDAETYLEACLDGTIVACEKIKRLAARILPEMRDGYRIWHYDPEYAIRPVRFIERFCRFTEGKMAGKPFILEPYERAIIETAFGFVDDDGLRRFQEVIVEIARKNGKGLWLSEELPTPNGWRKMGDLHVGDVVFGQDGKPSTIIAESEIFDKPTYVVTFEDGAQVKATDDHIWTVWDSDLGFDAGWHDMTTLDIVGDFRSGRYAVPLCRPVEYQDGGYANRNMFSLGAEWIAEDWDTAIPSPEEIGSVSRRREFLAGMVHASEHFHITEDDSVSTCNRDVADSVASLCASLGYLTRVYKRLGRYVCRFDIMAVSKSITSIERIPNEPTKCIAIDNPSHLYLVGRNYTATHNTQLCAALNIYMLMKSGEHGAQCYNVATTTEQASLCYGTTQEMIEENELLSSRIRKGRIAKRKVIGLNYDETNSYLCTLSGKAGTKDGLNPFFSVMDELGACRDHGDMYDQITEAIGAREEPMIFIITTENQVRHNIWDERKEYANKWLEGKVEDDRLLPFLYELDDRSEVFDEECWVKANPGLGTVKSTQFIRDRINKAAQSPERMPSLLMKDFNLVANQYTSFLRYEDCYQASTFAPDPRTDRYCVIGFDLAERNDLNACVALFRRPGEDVMYERAMFWLAEEQLGLDESNHRQRDGVPYLKWQSDGLIRIMEGSKVNQRVVVDFINELMRDGLYPMAVAYDPWHVDDWTKREIEYVVGSANMHEVTPWSKDISQAMKEHRIDLHDGVVNDNDNDILHWCRANVQAKRDNSDNVFPLKKGLKPENRIDGYMAEIYAYIAYKKHEESYLSMIGDDPARVVSRGSSVVAVGN